MRQTTMYCVRYNGTLIDFFTDPVITMLAGHKQYEIIKVTVSDVIDRPGHYWAWWDNENQEFCHVYPKRYMVEMCFPEPIDYYVKRGDGLLLPVTIQEVR